MDEVTSSDNALLSLYFQLTQNIPLDYLNTLLDECMKYASTNMIVDLIIITFNIRDYHHGKGLKYAFRKLYIYLYNNGYPRTMKMLLPLIKDFGTWKDYNHLALEFLESKNMNMVHEILKVIKEQILADKNEYDLSIKENRKPNLSFAEKYSPRENKKFDVLSKILANKLFPNDKRRLILYRKLVAKLNKQIDTVEIKMCNRNFSKINPNEIPFKSRLKYIKSFLNLNNTDGLRFPSNEDRNLCRENFINIIPKTKENRITFKQLINKVTNPNLNQKDKNIVNKGWNEIISTYLKNNNSLNLFPIIDISNTNNILSNIANVLGVIISELNSEKFRNKIYKLTNNFSFFEFTPNETLLEKLDKLNKSENFNSLDNIEKIFDSILKIAIENQLKDIEIPNIIIISDMSLADKAIDFESLYIKLYSKFFNEGVKAIGFPWSIPKVKFWNLDTKDDTETVKTLNISNIIEYNGYSQILFEHIIFGKELASESKKVITCSEVFRNFISRNEYNCVRKILSKSNEKLLDNYKFE